MNAKEMEQWLLKKGAVPVSKKIKKEPWYKEVSKLPPCLKPSGVAEDASDYNTGKKETLIKLKKLKKSIEPAEAVFPVKQCCFACPLSPFTFYLSRARSNE